MTRLNIEISQEMKKRIKLYAADTGKTIREVVVECVVDGLKLPAKFKNDMYEDVGGGGTIRKNRAKADR